MPDDEPDAPELSAERLLAAYAEGRREFRDRNLSRIVLPDAALADIDFQETRLDFGDLRASDLRNANLRDALLWGVDLRHASLVGANLHGADFGGAFMEGVDLRNSTGKRVGLSFCHLNDAMLSGLDIERVNLYGAHLIGARLDGAKLQNGTLRTANLERADLTNADLQGADLEAADLNHAVLRNAKLDGCDLSGANLRGADLRGCSLVGANLEGAHLDGAQLKGADFDRAHMAGATPGGLRRTLGTPSPDPLQRQTLGVRGFAPVRAGLFERRKVLLGASTPEQARPGAEFTARFVAHTEDFASRMQEILDGLSPTAKHHLGAGKASWAEGAEVRVVFSASGLEVDEPVQQFQWDGEYDVVNFDVRVPSEAPHSNVILKFDAFVGEFPAGRVRVDLTIAPEASHAVSVVTAPTFSTGFASYASDDRLRVLDRVSAMRQLTGIDIFMDCVSLRPSERWADRLYDEIEARDLFLLFWSTSASCSEWVTREWKAALETKGEQAMQIQPLDPLDAPPPPPELEHLHFSDMLVVIRAAFASRGDRQEP